MAGVISPTAGTRIETKDGYTFLRGTTATFKIIFMDDGRPTVVDTGTEPTAQILEPSFLMDVQPFPVVLATLTGTLVPGQQYEYQFEWDIPGSQTPLDEYIITYSGILGGITQYFGDEYFTIKSGAGQIGIRDYGYATVSDVRVTKFNIDQFLPKAIRNDQQARDNMIQTHINNATTKLREELNLSKSRGNTENNRLFVVYYTIWSILLASRGEDGSSVSDQNITFWKGEWSRVLSQEKRESQLQSIGIGRG